MRKLIVLFSLLFLFPLLVFANAPITSHHNSHAFVKSFGPTVTCDNLWQVASHLCKNTSLIRQQAMIALLKKNPHAFDKKNINGLMRGYWLKVPTYHEMKRISPIWSRREVAQQNKVWKKIQAKLGSRASVDQSNHAVCPSKHNQYLPKRFYHHVIQPQKSATVLPMLPGSSESTTASNKSESVSVMQQPAAPVVPAITNSNAQNQIAQLKVRVTELQQTNTFLSQHVSDLLSQKKLWEQVKTTYEDKIQGLEQQLALFTQRFGDQTSVTQQQGVVPAFDHVSLQGYLASLYDHTTVRNFLAKYPSLNNMLKDENLRVILTAVVGIVLFLLIILLLKLIVNLLKRGKKKEAVQEISLEEEQPFDEAEGEEELKAYEIPTEESDELEEIL